MVIIAGSLQSASATELVAQIHCGSGSIRLIQNNPKQMILSLSLSGNIELRAFTIKEPGRLVIDVSNVSDRCQREMEFEHHSSVAKLRVGKHPAFLRVVIEFREDVAPIEKWTIAGNSLRVQLAPPVASFARSDSAEISDPILNVPPSLPPLEFSGELYSKLATDTKDDTAPEASYGTFSKASIETRYSEDPNIQAAIGGDVRVFDEGGIDDAKTITSTRLQNAYINFLGEDYNLRIGSQVVRWGKADEVSPLDNINPEDLRAGPTERRSDRKLAVPMINAELFHNESRLQGVFVPFFTRNKVRFFDSDWSLFGYQDQLLVNETTPDDLSGAAYGARYADSLGTIDYAISLLSAPNRMPVIQDISTPPGFPGIQGSPSLRELGALAAELGTPMDFDYPRKEVIGIELESVLESVGLRADFAYSNREDYLSRQLINEKSPVWSYVMGADYRGPEDFYINLLFGQSYIQNYRSDLLFTKRTLNTLYSEISHEFWDDNLKLGLRGMYEFSQRSYLYNPYLQLLFLDDFIVEFGADILDGLPDSFLGTFRANDQVYGSMRYLF